MNGSTRRGVAAPDRGVFHARAEGAHVQDTFVQVPFVQSAHPDQSARIACPDAA
ncbi:MAG TPA: hypothetical protein VN702_16910 [Acetobacteraceae bacterium]|nr:hypothetical protein [Acetobacteraceae bacterium]